MQIFKEIQNDLLGKKECKGKCLLRCFASDDVLDNVCMKCGGTKKERNEKEDYYYKELMK